MKALQLIVLKDDQFYIPKEAEEFLRDLKKPLGVVTIVGKYRTGKSLFLNKVLLANSNGFKVCPTINSCTKGLWMWKETIQSQNGEDAQIIVIDTQGFGATEESSAYNNKILLLALLLSSFFIYNSVGCIDQNSLNSINVIANLAKEIQNRNSKDQRIQEEFPTFLWVVRDFTLHLVDRNGCTIPSKEYLEQALQIQKGTSDSIQNKNRIRRTIKHFFRDRDCFTMVRPVQNQQQLQKLNTLSDFQLRPQFLEQVSNLRFKILKKVKTKRIKNKTIDGQLFFELARSYVEIVNSGSLPNFDQSFKYLMKISKQKAMNTVINETHKQIDLKKQLYLSQLKIKQINEEILEKSLLHLKTKITDANDLLQATSQIKKQINLLLQNLTQNNKQKCQQKFRQSFNLFCQNINKDQAFHQWRQNIFKIKEEIQIFLKQIPLSPQYAYLHFQEWKNKHLVHYIEEAQYQLKQLLKQRQTEKKNSQRLVDKMKEQILQLQSQNTFLTRELNLSKKKVFQEEQIKNSKITSFQIRQNQLIQQINRLQDLMNSLSHQNCQIKLQLFNEQGKLNDCQLKKSAFQNDCLYYQSQLQSTKKLLHHSQCQNIQLKATVQNLKVQFQLSQSHIAMNQKNNQFHILFQKQIYEEEKKKNTKLEQQNIQLKQNLYSLKIQRQEQQNSIKKQQLLFKETLQQHVRRIAFETKQRQILLEVNENLSIGLRKIEEQVQVLDQKEKKMKEYKKSIKNACSLQCMHCSKFFVPSIFLNHLKICSSRSDFTNDENISVSQTKVIIKQTEVKEADGKPFTQYVLELRRNEQTWQVTRKYKQICNLAQGLRGVLPGINLSQSSYIANPNQCAKKAISIDDRKKILEKYLADLCSNPLVSKLQLWKQFIEDNSQASPPLQENIKQNNNRIHTPEEFLKMWTERNIRSKLSSMMKKPQQ